MVRDVVRVAVSLSNWIPSEDEWLGLLALVQPEEQQRIGRFRRSASCVGRHNPDARHALIGRLLLRKISSNFCGIPMEEIVLRRTKEKKPYLVLPSELREDFGTFNINVSHSGDWVVAIAGTDRLLGVDVQEIRRNRSQSVPRFLDAFQECFTREEWRRIRSPLGDEACMREFTESWVLKESYIKAIGIGFGFDLQKAFFAESLATDPRWVAEKGSISTDQCSRRQWQVKLGGVAEPKWFFETEWLDESHAACSCMGPFVPVPSFLVGQIAGTQQDANDSFVAESAAFQIWKVSDVTKR